MSFNQDNDRNGTSTSLSDIEKKLIRLESVVEHLPAAVLIEDENRTIVFVNDQFLQLFRLTLPRESLIGLPIDEVQQLSEQDRPGTGGLFKHLLKPNIPDELLLKDGTILERICSPIASDELNLGSMWQFRDVTEKRRALYALRESEERYRKLIELCPDPVFVHCEGIVVFANDKVKEYLRMEHAEELLGQNIYNLIHPDDHESSINLIKNAAQKNKPLEPAEARIVRKDGSLINMEFSLSPITYNGQEAFLGIGRDVTERKQQEQKLQEANEMLKRLSHMDGLTGIPNRRYFDETMYREWKRSARNSAPLSVIMLDIDYFKDYNDYYGHQGGDACLKLVAETLTNHLERNTDFVSRFGGEEFVIILPDTPRSGAAFVAERLRKAVEDLAIPHVRSNVSGVVTISVGAAGVVPNSFSEPQELIAQADKALYQAKQNGRNQVKLF
ncbi:sensor domain-containing diguanylate cyclase [Paenibacillus turpanensis]|uniref:sensor domain-containing diguanylate cyclase n=1 Tax=Paenibacillus turpanensis TaxID=2689078 RepID=UPI00140CB5B8|nr:diguanylate cyclase [Paenibacillus turpanensis]